MNNSPETLAFEKLNLVAALSSAGVAFYFLATYYLF